MCAMMSPNKSKKGAVAIRDSSPEPGPSTSKRAKRSKMSSDDEEDTVPKSKKAAPSKYVSKSKRSPGFAAHNKPAELFRKDLISAMKLPDSEPLQEGSYFLISDPWRQEWEKGVQVPVNMKEIMQTDVREMREKCKTGDFKIPHKMLHERVDSVYKKGLHELTGMQQLSEQVVRYDLDDLDVCWLDEVNFSRREMGLIQINEWNMERVMEALETQERAKDQPLFPSAIQSNCTSEMESTVKHQSSAPKIVPVGDRVTNMECHEKMTAVMKTEEGMGIEYDEDIVCDVCCSPDSEDTNEMVFCDGCDVCIHQACYGIQSIPEGSWLCRTCALGIKPNCMLCPKVGGAMKSTRSGTKWAHVSCALWIPEVSIGIPEKMEPITKISNIPPSRWALVCCLCKERVGACIQCSVKTCKTAFHVTCGFSNGLEMKTVLDETDEQDGVKLKAYCPKHTKKRERGHSESDTDSPRKESPPTPKKEMTQQERENLRAQKLKGLEEDFHSLVDVPEVSEFLQLDQEIVELVYVYWKLKRQCNWNKPLLTPKTEEADILERQQEDSLVARMKMFVHLRQDLERVRNLCYMIGKREKTKRQFFRSKEYVFTSMVRVLLDKSLHLSNADVDDIVHNYHFDSIYDDYGLSVQHLPPEPSQDEGIPPEMEMKVEKMNAEWVEEEEKGSTMDSQQEAEGMMEDASKEKQAEEPSLVEEEEVEEDPNEALPPGERWSGEFVRSGFFMRRRPKKWMKGAMAGKGKKRKLPSVLSSPEVSAPAISVKAEKPPMEDDNVFTSNDESDEDKEKLDAVVKAIVDKSDDDSDFQPTVLPKLLMKSPKSRSPTLPHHRHRKRHRGRRPWHLRETYKQNLHFTSSEDEDMKVEPILGLRSESLVTQDLGGKVVDVVSQEDNLVTSQHVTVDVEGDAGVTDMKPFQASDATQLDHSRKNLLGSQTVSHDSKVKKTERSVQELFDLVRKESEQAKSLQHSERTKPISDKTECVMKSNDVQLKSKQNKELDNVKNSDDVKLKHDMSTTFSLLKVSENSVKADDSSRLLKVGENSVKADDSSRLLKVGENSVKADDSSRFLKVVENSVKADDSSRLLKVVENSVKADDSSCLLKVGESIVKADDSSRLLKVVENSVKADDSSCLLKVGEDSVKADDSSQSKFEKASDHRKSSKSKSKSGLEEMKHNQDNKTIMEDKNRKHDSAQKKQEKRGEKRKERESRQKHHESSSTSRRSRRERQKSRNDNIPDTLDFTCVSGISGVLAAEPLQKTDHSGDVCTSNSRSVQGSSDVQKLNHEGGKDFPDSEDLMKVKLCEEESGKEREMFQQRDGFMLQPSAKREADEQRTKKGKELSDKVKHKDMETVEPFKTVVAGSGSLRRSSSSGLPNIFERMERSTSSSSGHSSERSNIFESLERHCREGSLDLGLNDDNVQLSEPLKKCPSIDWPSKMEFHLGASADPTKLSQASSHWFAGGPSKNTCHVQENVKTSDKLDSPPPSPLLDKSSMTDNEKMADSEKIMEMSDTHEVLESVVESSSVCHEVSQSVVESSADTHEVSQLVVESSASHEVSQSVVESSDSPARSSPVSGEAGRVCDSPSQPSDDIPYPITRDSTPGPSEDVLCATSRDSSCFPLEDILSLSSGGPCMPDDQDAPCLSKIDAPLMSTEHGLHFPSQMTPCFADGENVSGLLGDNISSVSIDSVPCPPSESVPYIYGEDDIIPSLPAEDVPFLSSEHEPCVADNDNEDYVSSLDEETKGIENTIHVESKQAKSVESDLPVDSDRLNGVEANGSYMQVTTDTVAGLETDLQIEMTTVNDKRNYLQTEIEGVNETENGQTEEIDVAENSLPAEVEGTKSVDAHNVDPIVDETKPTDEVMPSAPFEDSKRTSDRTDQPDLAQAAEKPHQPRLEILKIQTSNLPEFCSMQTKERSQKIQDSNSVIQETLSLKSIGQPEELGYRSNILKFKEKPRRRSSIRMEDKLENGESSGARVSYRRKSSHEARLKLSKVLAAPDNSSDDDFEPAQPLMATFPRRQKHDRHSKHLDRKHHGRHRSSEEVSEGEESDEVGVVERQRTERKKSHHWDNREKSGITEKKDFVAKSASRTFTDSLQPELSKLLKPSDLIVEDEIVKRVEDSFLRRYRHSYHQSRANGLLDDKQKVTQLGRESKRKSKLYNSKESSKWLRSSGDGNMSLTKPVARIRVLNEITPERSSNYQTNLFGAHCIPRGSLSGYKIPKKSSSQSVVLPFQTSPQTVSPASTGPFSGGTEFSSFKMLATAGPDDEPGHAEGTLHENAPRKTLTVSDGASDFEATSTMSSEKTDGHPTGLDHCQDYRSGSPASDVSVVAVARRPDSRESTPRRCTRSQLADELAENSPSTHRAGASGSNKMKLRDGWLKASKFPS